VAEIAQELVDRFGDPPPLVRNLLYVAVVRSLAQQAAIQSIATEDGVAVLRARDDDPLPKEDLEARVPRGVTVGRSLLRVELGDGWRERLRKTLEHVAAVSAVDAPAEA
jgi:transcription-repair coupling factor (superfamily II helicase)